MLPVLARRSTLHRIAREEQRRKVVSATRSIAHRGYINSSLPGSRSAPNNNFLTLDSIPEIAARIPDRVVGLHMVVYICRPNCHFIFAGQHLRLCELPCSERISPSSRPRRAPDQFAPLSVETSTFLMRPFPLNAIPSNCTGMRAGFPRSE